jgi:PKD repeat protein
MKKIMTLFFAISITFIGKAQITIINTDLPGNGDTLRYSTANLDTLTENTYIIAGANVTWDFSHLEATGQAVDHYKPSLQTPYAGFFFGLNRYGKLEADSIGAGQFVFKDIYRFYKNSTSKFEIEGVGMKYSGFPIPSYYADSDELYQFPLDYNDFDSSTFSYTLNLLTLGTLQTIGYRINTVDGWGQITTPYGTFNALRVTTDIVSRDSIALGGLFGFGFDNHQREVKWLATAEGYPVMQVSGAVTNGQFNPNTVTYRDSFRVTPISPFAPTASFVADNLTPTTYDTVSFTSNAFLSSHAWTFSPTTITYVNGTSSSSRTPEVVFNAPGFYDVSLAVANNFGSDDTTTLVYITVTQGTNTSGLMETNDFKIFPNPTSDVLNLEYSLSKTEDINIAIHDLQGRQVAILKSETQSFGNQKASFNLANYNLAEGVYLIKMSIGGDTQWFKIVLQ